MNLSADVRAVLSIYSRNLVCYQMCVPRVRDTIEEKNGFSFEGNIPTLPLFSGMLRAVAIAVSQRGDAMI